MRSSYFLCFLIIIISGNPDVGILGKEVVYIGTLGILLLWSWLKKPIRLDKASWLTLFLFVALSSIHVFDFGSEVILAEFGFLIKLFIALLLVKLVPDFRYQYAVVMSVLGLISLVCYFLYQVGVDVFDVFSLLQVPSDDGVLHIGVFNFYALTDDRNSGMFWEPGAFAGYLVLALLFLMGKKGRNRKIPIIVPTVLIVSLMTTLSTTGYLAFFVIALIYVQQSDYIKRGRWRLVFVPMSLVIITIVGVYTYQTVPFLQEKIDSQQRKSINEEGDYYKNRIGNFYLDLEILKGRPLFGWSPRHTTRGEGVEEIVSGQGNGLSGFAVKYGVVGLSIFLYLTYLGFVRQYGDARFGIAATGVVMILLSGEQFMNFPLFMTLMFSNVASRQTAV